MSTKQINRNGGKNRHYSGKAGASPLMNYTSVFIACNAFLISRGLDTSDFHKPSKEEKNEQSEQQLA